MNFLVWVWISLFSDTSHLHFGIHMRKGQPHQSHDMPFKATYKARTRDV